MCEGTKYPLHDTKGDKMKKLLLLCSLTLLTNCSTPPKQETTLRQHNKTYCYDGDTCYITFRGSNYTLRLKDIDTPEINSQCKEERELAIKAKEFINLKIRKALHIQIEITGQDKYQRMLGNIYIDGYNIGRWLIEEKLAKKSNIHTYKDISWCKE